MPASTMPKRNGRAITVQLAATKARKAAAINRPPTIATTLATVTAPRVRPQRRADRLGGLRRDHPVGFPAGKIGIEPLPVGPVKHHAGPIGSCIGRWRHGEIRRCAMLRRGVSSFQIKFRR